MPAAHERRFHGCGARSRRCVLSYHAFKGASMASPTAAAPTMRLYDEDAENLLKSEQFPDRVTLLPPEGGRVEAGQRIRILWGQDLLRDLLDGRYRTVVCGVNDSDNSHGIIARSEEHTSELQSRFGISYAV